MRVRNDEHETLVSLDDIDMVFIENQQTSLTATLLSKLAQKNICTVFVDEKFMPSAITVPLYKNSRVSLVQAKQILVSKPKHNRLWRTIIVAKIKHQSHVLQRCRNSKAIHGLWNKVVSADRGNVEALAASIYFPALFGNDFTRRDDNGINAALNYGYSVMRSSIARHLIAYGLNPVFGIFHSSKINNFNLADDFIEIFRPVVDEFVFKNVKGDQTLCSWHKQKLSSMLYEYNMFNEEENRKVSLGDAIKMLVASYQSFCLGKRDDINIPVLI